METEQTLSTRELAGGTDTGEDRRGRFERDEPEHDEPERDAQPTATADATAETGDESRAGANMDDDAPELLPGDENAEFQRRWEAIQTGFVDEPRRTVEQADELVANVMRRLAEGFAAERERLEGQWGRGEDVSTEDLRVALQRYRGFFQRLLSA
jgi:hypothetical protein